ncbi:MULTISPECIES: SDR family NAD(P)-dependent oxidoreductase [unclassified Sphingopyxis]|jgi:NAD(P)-dependent dehydrogenase (short-subunit alcohol dehydrogenase family)|uniref:SDR family NAD(P)-dependent oxidoreductase n=1 Tax=unclassified Sphingopyxis TaxID=2614943 RepID=UPI0006BF60C2|nr:MULTISPECIES: SDR family oxidoreductase [unclassified Sphingopyxis]USI76659.1 SDR family oxidoreductase [Sphingopyxis sp. USTB-05]GAO80921.1 dehydrogenase [Sphingopyxis sp. C-1]
MQQRLGGKVALVTGGTSGIGAATVERLTNEGAKVVFTGSNAEAAATVEDRTGAIFRAHRVEDAAAWDALMAEIEAEYGRLDIAFANAGTEAGDASVEDIGIDAWDHIVGVNQTGVMLTVQHAIRAMAKNPQGPQGSIIVNSSMNAHRAMGNYVAYSVTKAAVVALVKSAAIHCAGQGYAIRVNAVLPGVVETDMIRGVIDRSPDPVAARAAFEGMAPMKRMAQLGEVSALVAFLASDEAAFISGADYVIDGATTAGMMGV